MHEMSLLDFFQFVLLLDHIIGDLAEYNMVIRTLHCFMASPGFQLISDESMSKIMSNAYISVLPLIKAPLVRTGCSGKCNCSKVTLS